MIVPIRRGENELPEWVMIELQGELERASTNSTSREFIGDLHYDKNGIPILIIGMHMLHGKEAALPKPIAVLEKSDCEVASEMDYTVKSIIKKKLIFKGRPKPIVTDVPLTV